MIKENLSEKHERFTREMQEMTKERDLANSVKVQRNSIEFLLKKWERVGLNLRHERQRQVLELMLEIDRI
jgi:hypothetical protein